MAARPLTPGQEEFARKLAAATGLEVPTVRTWVLAETGERTDRDGNPLNIDRAHGYPQYATTDAAVAATVKFLRQGYYDAIRTTARDPRGNVQAELYAIQQSPFEETGYNSGILLAGAYRRLYPKGKAVVQGSGVGEITDAVTAPVTAATDAVTGAVGSAASWAEGVAGKALLYVALSGLAFALIVMGVARSLGVGPREAVGAMTKSGAGTVARSDPRYNVPF